MRTINHLKHFRSHYEITLAERERGEYVMGRDGLFVFDMFNILAPCQIVSYLLDLPEKDEEEVERAQINNFDTLWGETGRSAPSTGSMINTQADDGRAQWFASMSEMSSVLVV